MDGEASVPCEAWVAAELDQESREAFFRSAVERQTSIEADAKAIRRQGIIFGSAGLAIAVVMTIAAAAVFLKKPAPPAPGFVLVDKENGVIGPAVAAPDAPKLFGEMVNERALRDFITRCEGYIPETWQRIDFHSCMVMASPDEQRRLAAVFDHRSPDYPPALFGAHGWAMPTRFLAFLRRETGPHQTLHYEVRYERTEVANGREQRPHYTAQVYWQWRPDLEMASGDRLLNEAGMQVVSFSTVRD